METASGQPPASSGPAPSRPSGQSTSGQGLSLWMTFVPALCLVAVAAVWWQTHTQLTAMRSQQRELLEAIDTLQGVSYLDVSNDPALGADDAVVTLVEFSDYECPFCIRHFTETMAQIDEQFIRTGRIQYVFRDFPIVQLHPGAMLAHQAARCAAEQGRFWEIHPTLFGAPGSHSPEALEALATKAGVSLDPFRECLTSNRTLADVQASVTRAAQLGANGTPSFFVGIREPDTNRVRILQAISGAHPFAEFERVIEAVEARLAP